MATGSQFFTSTTADRSVLGFVGLGEEFDASWSIVTDRLTRPTLDSASLELVRAQRLTSLRGEVDDPDAVVHGIAEAMAFADHPYELALYGTTESIASLTAGDLGAYHASQFVRSRLLVSVVGPVERPRLEAAILNTLAALPLGTYAWAPPDSWAKDEPRVLVEERALPTNYIVGYFAGPSSSSEDFAAFQVALSVLGGVISSDIRERGLSYAAGAQLVDRAAPGGSIYVTTLRPRETFEIVNDAIEGLRAGRIPQNIVSDFARSFYLERLSADETGTSQADVLASSTIITGRPLTALEYAEAFRRVTGSDIRRVLRDYLENVQYAFLGSPEAVPGDLLRRY